MFDPSSFVNPTPLAHADASRDVLPRGGTSQRRTTRFNLYDLEMRNARGFNVWPEVYFSGSENVTEFSEGIDNQIKLLEITSYLSCAYLKGHLMGRALDWKYLETRFYASQQTQNQKPTDFVYDLLKLHKKLELGMSEKALVDHIFVRFEPQVQDYEEVRNPQTAIQLLEVLVNLRKDIRARQHWVREIAITWKDEVGMSVGCLMLVIIEEIGEILKWYIDQIMVEMIIEVAIRTTVKEISGSRAGISFKTMIADLTIGDINLKIEVKMTILVEGTKEIGVRVKILVEAVENKWEV
ncbi:uncharacterized protein TNCV_3298091 [Trichonephila clavipes]|uniref:Uncharacterized protein n=1 Tax=Trichonephila clavipes TaxID=2585209 RepID=A0A8X6VTI2_TRICX|nr:uncharacterized protein TNCV_3298091 [Trichonephila clavipes]